MLSVIVEFTGLSRAITNTSAVTLSVPEGTTYRDIIHRIGELYPGLIGVLIAEDGETFLSSNLFIINGDFANPAMMMNDSPKNGEHLHLMSIITGG